MNVVFAIDTFYVMLSVMLSGQSMKYCVTSKLRRNKKPNTYRERGACTLLIELCFAISENDISTRRHSC